MKDLNLVDEEPIAFVYSSPISAKSWSALFSAA